MDLELRDDANAVIFKWSVPIARWSEQFLRTLLWEQVQPEIEKAWTAAVEKKTVQTLRLRLVP